MSSGTLVVRRHLPRAHIPGQLSDTRVGAAIRHRRHHLELHLDAASRSAGIHQAVLSRIERGERPCRVTELQSIAEALDTSATALILSAKQDTDKDA